MRRSILAGACAVVLTAACQASASPIPPTASASSPSPTSRPSAALDSIPPSPTRGTTPEPSEDDVPASWIEAGGSMVGSLDHAVLLGDGRVLVLSDTEEAPATTAQIWDPGTNGWAPAEELNKYRTQYVAVPLADGRALVTGGENVDQVSFSSTYVFDPSSETWSKSGLLGTARTSPSAAALEDGRVLIAGGYFDNGGPTGGARPDGVLAAFHAGSGIHDVDIPTFAVAMATAELFDPTTGTWSSTGPMRYARFGAAAVTLADGRVLVFGSGGGAGDGVESDRRSQDSAEVYDPSTGRFSLAGTLPPIDGAAIEARGMPDANPVPTDAAEINPGTLVALQDGGAVLIGVSYYWKHQGDLSRSFRYDASHNTWSEIGETWAVVGEPTPVPLFLEGVPNLADSAAAPLPDGRVLVAGGSGPTHRIEGEQGYGSEVTDVALYYEPSTDTWPEAPTMPAPASGARAVSLADGSVFVFGGSVYDRDEVAAVTQSRFIP
jgi:hypothetical protein